MKPEASRKDNIKFVVGEWDDAPALLTSMGYTPSDHILMFEVHNNFDSLSLHLYLGPGPEAIRQRILEMVRANPEVFMMPSSLTGKWLPIFSRHLLRQETYDNLDEEEREEEIRLHWNEFVEEDLPRIEVALKKETWIWDSVQVDG